MKRYLFLYLAFAVVACNSEIKNSSPEETKPKSSQDKIKVSKNLSLIRKIIRQTKPVILPLAFRLHQGYTPESLQLVSIDYKSEENNVLVKNQQNFIYGYLPDTSRYYGIITFIPADAFVPVLFIYSKGGQFISQESLLVRGCGADCGIEKCTCDAIIDEKLNVTLVDTNHYYTCDEQGKELKNTRKYFLDRKEFSIDVSGKITNRKEFSRDIK